MRWNNRAGTWSSNSQHSVFPTQLYRLLKPFMMHQQQLLKPKLGPTSMQMQENHSEHLGKNRNPEDTH